MMANLTRFVAVSLTIAPLLFYYIIKRKYKKMLELETQETKFYHQLIAVDTKNFDCRPHVMEQTECSEWCSLAYLNTIRKFISSANLSICLCMYIATLKSINYELIQAHKRGIKVRVITDRVMFKTKPVQNNYMRLKVAGVPYKIQPSSESMMHHKFCLIDKESQEEAKMFFGSLNLTTQGLCNNFDQVILTNNIHIIEKFSEEFEYLWDHFLAPA